MKIQVIIKRLFLAIVLLSVVGCSYNGLTREEASRVKNRDKGEIMSLFTVFTQSDSLFLRKISRKVEKQNINSSLIKLLKSRMLATVNDTLNDGVGIAAPQVGVSISMILVKRVDKANTPFEVYFNPKIIESSDSVNSGNEGCLSVPGFRGRLERSQHITIAYNDSVGDKKKEEINGFTSVIFQHEIDHLSGVLYYDHVYGGFKSLVPVPK